MTCKMSNKDLLTKTGFKRVELDLDSLPTRTAENTTK